MNQKALQLKQKVAQWNFFKTEGIHMSHSITYLQKIRGFFLIFRVAGDMQVIPLK